jgi:formate dehydrogenase subunit gamma
LIGADAFGVIASASMQGHNLFGPLFILALLALFVTFVRGNGYRWIDLKWVLKAGGMFGGHASSGRYNFGEKSWFWWATLCGITLSVSGMLMLFPDHLPGLLAQAGTDVPPERFLMQLANLAHGIAAVAFIAFGLGHIYLGTVGMEGALEGMTRGTVDENWAKEHHDLWYEEHLAEATTDVAGAEVKAAAGKI